MNTPEITGDTKGLHVGYFGSSLSYARTKLSGSYVTPCIKYFNNSINNTVTSKHAIFESR